MNFLQYLYKLQITFILSLSAIKSSVEMRGISGLSETT